MVSCPAGKKAKSKLKESVPGGREPDQKPDLQPVGPRQLCGRYQDCISNNKQEKVRGESYEIYHESEPMRFSNEERYFY